jgi:hypothetical protein
MLNREQYLLTLIQEECAELSQRASKALRFGLYEVQPGQELDNWERLRGEFVDLFTSLYMLDWVIVDVDVKDDDVQTKANKIKKYMQLSVDRGILGDNFEH